MCCEDCRKWRRGHLFIVQTGNLFTKAGFLYCKTHIANVLTKCLKCKKVCLCPSIFLFDCFLLCIHSHVWCLQPIFSGDVKAKEGHFHTECFVCSVCNARCNTHDAKVDSVKGTVLCKEHAAPPPKPPVSLCLVSFVLSFPLFDSDVVRCLTVLLGAQGREQSRAVSGLPAAHRLRSNDGAQGAGLPFRTFIFWWLLCCVLLSDFVWFGCAELHIVQCV